MLNTIRTALFSLVMLLFTLVYGVFSFFLFLLPSPIAHRIIVSWCVCMVFFLKWICGVRYRVTGLENIQNHNRPFVVLSKHQSTWETFFLQSLFFPSATILKKELLKIPLFGIGLRLLRPIPIDRSNPREALKQVKAGGLERLSQGLHLILFPEGTRVALGEKGKYARSGPDIALTAGADIVPVALNSAVCWPSGQWKKIPGMIDVVVGEPIETKDRSSKELIQQVEAWIEAKQALIECRNTHAP